MNHFHFTLGPVQGFVSQARRTRDFWAGSFLLSYLTAHAMKAVQAQSGTTIMPDVSGDNMLARVSAKSGDGPTIGSLPNCFEAEVPDTFNGGKVADAVRTEWERIADAVWEHDKLSAAGANKTLWNNQIKNFWEIAWVIAPPEEAAALAMRKNWRNHYPPDQVGDKCTMMGEWQELSGVPAPGNKGQKEFWTTVRSNIKSELELRDGERLCAIAYVKRRFVHVWGEKKDWKGLNPGWKLPTGVPSTSYMAAVHWIEQMLKHADPEKIKAFRKAAKEIADYGEWSTSIRCIEEQHGAWGNGQLFASLDGRVFFRSALENEREFDAEKSQATLKALNTLADTELEPGRKIGHPSPFYAILLMDGDNLGKTKAAMGGDAKKLSAALGEFTGKVPGIVQEKNGFLVYAGGDDVLALLPLEDALGCALELRTAYMNVFEDKKAPEGNYSISAAVIYAHMKLPLTLALKDSHRLLDDVAKDKTGRDAIAVRVWKPGGVTVTWATRWGVNGANVTALSKLTADFQQAEEGEPGHAGKPLFRIRERLEMLGDGSGFTDDQIRKLLVAEYATSGVLNKEERKQEIAEKRIAELLPLCKKPDDSYGAEAAMLLRFLVQKGVER
jgi:CRISPR-associated protein Cmr2